MRLVATAIINNVLRISRKRTAVNRCNIVILKCCLRIVSNRTTVNSNITTIIVLQGVNTTRKRAALNRQRRLCYISTLNILAFLALARNAFIIIIAIDNQAREITTLFYGNILIDCHAAMVQNVIVAVFINLNVTGFLTASIGATI